MAAIINSGRAKIALQQGSSLPLNVTKFVFANIPGLDTGAAVNLAQGMPIPAHIVYEQAVTAQGYVALDQVVYSIILNPNVGDFYFNWVGLVDADNVLIAVSYTPIQYKYQTVGLAVGNTLTRNFLLQFNNAVTTTGISVSAETWQIDFIGRLDDIDEKHRRDSEDFYGNGLFINDGFKITSAGSVVSVKAGFGHVYGLRVGMPSDQVITTGVLPRDIYIEAYETATASESVVIAEIKTSPVGVPLTHYTDAIGDTHYLLKIATVSAAYAVTDLRKFITSASSIIEFLLAQLALKAALISPALAGTPTAPTAAAGTNTNQLSTTAFVQAVKVILETAIALKAPLASPALTGTPTAPTAAAGTNTNQLSTTAFVQTAIAALIDSSPGALNTLNELAAALGDNPNFATDMINLLATKAPLISPAMTGTPTMPTAAAGTNTTQGANTAFVQAAINLLAAVARTGNAADLTGTLAAARLPFSYGTAMTAGFLAQRDPAGNLLVPDVPINESSAKAANMNTVISCVNAAISALVASSPTTLNTLNELAAALGNNPNFATTITNALAAKAPLISPALSGTPTAPTAAAGTNTGQLATTAFAQNLVTTSSVKWSGSATSVDISGFGFGYYLVKTNWSGAYGLLFYCGVRMTTVYFAQIISTNLATGVIEVNTLGIVSGLVNNFGAPLSVYEIRKIGA